MARARIVIVNYNGGGFVEGSIASALSQSADCEVVVVDNGSNDGSPATIAQQYPAVRVLQTGANVGFAAAANRGAFAQSRDFEYVAFLNPDAYATPQWIERTTEWMARNGVAVASCTVSGADTPFFVGGQWRPFIGTAYKLPAFAGESSDWISGCAMIVSRAAFEQLGGFDESYFLYYEDVDLSLRAARADMRLGVYEETLVAHPEEGRSAAALGSLWKRRIGLTSKGRLVRRFVPPYALPSALAFQCLISPAVNGASLIEYPALVAAFLKGFLLHASPGGGPRHSVAPEP